MPGINFFKASVLSLEKLKSSMKPISPAWEKAWINTNAAREIVLRIKSSGHRVTLIPIQTIHLAKKTILMKIFSKTDGKEPKNADIF